MSGRNRQAPRTTRMSNSYPANLVAMNHIISSLDISTEFLTNLMAGVCVRFSTYLHSIHSSRRSIRNLLQRRNNSRELRDCGGAGLVSNCVPLNKGSCIVKGA